MNDVTKAMKIWGLIGVSFGTLNAFVDLSMIFTALPSLQKDLGLSILQMQWVMNAFLLSFCIFMPMMGYLGDMYGRKRIMMIGLSVFALMSLLAGLANSPGLLITARLFQGISAATLVPSSLGLIPTLFTKNERGKAIGIWTTITSIGIAAGPFLAGVIVNSLSWRWVFFFHIPIAIFALIICLLAIPKIQELPDSIGNMDWLGFGLIAIGLTSLVVAITEASHWDWSSPWTISLLVLSFILFVILYFVEKHGKNSVINFKLILNRIYFPASLSQVAITVLNVVGLFFMPQYLQNIQSLPPYIVGALISIIPLMVVILAPLSGYIADKIGPKVPVIFGLIDVMVSALILTSLPAHGSLYLVLIAFVIWGTGWAFIIPPSTTAAVGSVPVEKAGVVSGLLWTIQNISGTIGLAIGGAIYSLIEGAYLNKALIKLNVHFTNKQITLVRSLLSDSHKVIARIEKITHANPKIIITIFKSAFLRGLSASMWFVIVVSVITLLFVIFVMESRSKQRNESTVNKGS